MMRALAAGRHMPRMVLGAVLALALLGAGCNDVREFGGGWGGAVTESPAATVRSGFATTATADLQLARVDRVEIEGTLTTSDGILQSATLATLRPASNDVLANIQFEGDPLRTYFTTAATTDGAGAALVLVTLLPGDRVEVRVIRPGPPELYGVFKLTRK